MNMDSSRDRSTAILVNATNLPMRSVDHSTQRAKCVPETFESHKPSVPELLLYIHSAAPNSIPPNITLFSLSMSVLIRKIIASGSAYYLGWLLPSYSVDE